MYLKANNEKLRNLFNIIYLRYLSELRYSFSVHDDNTVRAFVDCRWLRTDVLEKDALDTPRDADLIIGYLFSVSCLLNTFPWQVFLF